MFANRTSFHSLKLYTYLWLYWIIVIECLSWKTERHPQDNIFFSFFPFMSCRERALNLFFLYLQKVHWADYPIDYVVRHALSCPSRCLSIHLCWGLLLLGAINITHAFIHNIRAVEMQYSMRDSEIIKRKSKVKKRIYIWFLCLFHVFFGDIKSERMRITFHWLPQRKKSV